MCVGVGVAQVVSKCLRILRRYNLYVAICRVFLPAVPLVFLVLLVVVVVVAVAVALAVAGGGAARVGMVVGGCFCFRLYNNDIT